MPLRNHRVAAVAAGAAILVGCSSFGAVAGQFITSSDIGNGEVHKADIGKNAVGSNEILNGSVHGRDLADGLLSRIATPGADGARGPQGPKGDPGPKGDQGPAGPQGAKGDPASDVKGTSTLAETFAPTTIENIGGRFADRATTLGSFSLPAGTYLLSSDGFFSSTTATSGMTRLQLAIRADGADFGTCFTGAASVLADREATCSTTRTVTVDAPTEVTVYGFGYADDQGSADSGKFWGAAFVSAVRVG